MPALFPMGRHTEGHTHPVSHFVPGHQGCQEFLPAAAQRMPQTPDCRNHAGGDVGLGSGMYIIQFQGMGQHGIQHRRVGHRPFFLQGLPEKSHPRTPFFRIQVPEGLLHIFYQRISHSPHSYADQIQSPIGCRLLYRFRERIPRKAGRKRSQLSQRCLLHHLFHFPCLSFL